MNRIEILSALYPYSRINKLIRIYYDLLLEPTEESDFSLSRLEKQNFSSVDDLMIFVIEDIKEAFRDEGMVPCMAICLN